MLWSWSSLAIGKAFSAMADATMNGVLTAESFAAIPAALEQQYGELQKIGAATASRNGDLRLFAFDVVLQNADLTMLVVQDGAGKVAGLRVLKATPRNEQWTAPPYVDRSRFSESPAQVEPRNFRSRQTSATLPKSNLPVPAVVLVHGSGPERPRRNHRPNKPFRDLAWAWPPGGLPSFVSTNGPSPTVQQMNPATATLEGRVHR